MTSPIEVKTLEDLQKHCHARLRAAKNTRAMLAPDTPETPASEAERRMWTAIGEANAFYAVIVTINKMIGVENETSMDD